MKEFNGTVVIVDPEKFAKSEDLGKKIDTNLTRISLKLGFHGLFFSETGIGNCFLTYHKIDNIKEYYQGGSENYVKEMISNSWSGYIKPQDGQVSSDSGTVGVFLLDDIKRYNPEALKDLKEGVDYVVIKKYRGKIGYLRDKYGMIHFYGTGSTNFYTL